MNVFHFKHWFYLSQSISITVKLLQVNNSKKKNAKNFFFLSPCPLCTKDLDHLNRFFKNK